MLRRQLLWLHAGLDRPSIRDFLHRNPIVLLDDLDRLGVGYFYDAGRPPRLDISYAEGAFAFRRLFDMNEFLR